METKVTTWQIPTVNCRAKDRQSSLAMAKKKDRYAVEFARKGGKASAKKLTPEQRREKARKAAQARWQKRKAAR
jgi:hypothetical protein